MKIQSDVGKLSADVWYLGIEEANVCFNFCSGSIWYESSTEKPYGKYVELKPVDTIYAQMMTWEV
jgi:hypothetical protein